MANAPKILGTDTLRDAFPKLNDAIDMTNNFQTQIDQMTINGDSSVEAAQARVDADGNAFTTLKARLDDSDSQLADVMSLNNNTIVPTYVNGQLEKVEEKDGDTVKSSSSLTYNTDGTVNTITEVINGKTAVTTLNYENGEFSSASREVL